MEIKELRRRALLKVMGLMKAKDFAEKYGLDASYLSQILNNHRGMGEKAAIKMEVKIGLKPGTFLAPTLESLGLGETGAHGDPASNTEPGPPITTEPRRIEIMGTAQLGDGGYWEGLDAAEGWVETYSRDEKAYALRLRGESMAPAIRDGWIAVCEPGHRLVPGEYVKITLNDDRSMVKELLFENADGVSVMSVNSAHGRHNFAWDQIRDIHYVGAILPPSKVLCWI